MIVRRPGTWGTMNGEGTDDDSSSKGTGMSGLQQVKAVESSRPGSSGSSNSSSGWGTCSELLLVSAVKKHGVPNWNLVASELRARAVVLSISPSCFTEEACKFKYNVLKGKFASNSSSGGGGSVSSPDDDLDGVSWFEELRKLRMSHLKEELQVYDSSIGQLQSRISKLQEERAQRLSPQSVMKQYDSSCRVVIDSNPNKDCKPNIPASSPICHYEESLETSQDSALTSAAPTAAAPPPDNLPINAIGDVDQPTSVVTEGEEIEVQEGSPDLSTPQRTGQVSTDEAERGANLTSGQSMPSESHPPSPEKVAENGEDQVCATTWNEVAGQVSKDEFMGTGEPDLEMFTSTSDHAVVEEQPEAPPGAVGVCGDGVDTVVATGFAVPEKLAEVIEDLAERTQGTEPDMAVSAPLPPQKLPSTAVEILEVLPDREVPEPLGVASGHAPSSTPGAEASNDRDVASKVESIPKKESRLSRLSLSYGRAEKEKRLRAKEEAKLKRMSESEEVREPGDDRPPVSAVEEVTVLTVDERENIHDTSAVVPSEQNENGRVSFSDPSPLHIVESIRQDAVVLDSPPLAIEADIHNSSEAGGLADESNRVGADIWPNGNDVLQAGSSLVSSKGVEPRSPDDDMPLLTVALGPDPARADEDCPSLTTSPTSKSSPNAGSEHEVFLGVNSKLDEEEAFPVEVPNEVKSASSSMLPAETDGKSEESLQPQEANHVGVMMEREVAVEDVKDDAQAKVDEEVDMVAEVAEGGEEGETMEPTDPGTSRSVGENVPEALDAKGSEDGQEEVSRDAEVQQPFPEYTDSQIDKSEVGSSMDSIEDMSPSSRKNRREPKVPGKFLPLLECLRVICAHKFAPLFRQRQEYQDSSAYDRLVRRHVDLSIVRARLEDGAYSGSVEFFRDLLLIFTNALVYNSSDSQEYVGAKALRSCALIEMDKILQTEALLKQNGPATRKREVRKSMEVHKARVSSTGSEVRKKGILKGSNDAPAALDNNQSQGGARSAHIAFEETPHGGRSSNSNGADRDLDVKIEATFKKAAATRIVKEETPRKESQKPEFLSESGSRIAGGGGSLGKKVKVDRDALKTGLHGQVLADLRASGGRLNVESIGTKTAPAKTKDVICIDLEKKATYNSSSVIVSSGLLVEKQRTTPLSRQTSTSRVSRYSKRGGDSTSSNPKKRVRK